VSCISIITAQGEEHCNNIIETAKSISTKFFYDNRNHQVVIAGAPNTRPTKYKMADGRHLKKKPLNRYISAEV